MCMYCLSIIWWIKMYIYILPCARRQRQSVQTAAWLPTPADVRRWRCAWTVRRSWRTPSRGEASTDSRWPRRDGWRSDDEVAPCSRSRVTADAVSWRPALSCPVSSLQLCLRRKLTMTPIDGKTLGNLWSMAHFPTPLNHRRRNRGAPHFFGRGPRCCLCPPHF